MMKKLIPGLLALAACAGQEKKELAAGDLRSGTVDFPAKVSPALKEDFNTAVALLHSFFYDEARRRFLEIAAKEPGNAMAWWGVAMSWYHPLWAPPTPEEMEKGAEAAKKARAAGPRGPLEEGFVAAIEAFFTGEEKAIPGAPVAQSCHGPRVHSARALCFRDTLAALRAKHPDELEVQVFYALALLGTAPPTDKLYQNQLAATAILEPLFRKHPNHPGVAHYIIHAYDYPSLAARGLEAAARYGEIAPWVPHALHMPSHIYTRLGMWKESIASNLASAEAARDHARRVQGGAAGMDELHALDYLVFGYLQTGRERKAEEILAHVRGLQKFSAETNFATAYAVGAIPARWTLERRRWSEAAALDVLHPEQLKKFPFALAHVEFARAVGGARSGRPEIARDALAKLEKLRDALKDPKFQWWINQVEIQRLAAAGWLAHAEKDAAKAVDFLRRSSEMEDASGTHPVTPGQILPAREQLGELLLELGRSTEALAEFERSLKAFPNRFNGHFGAGRAADRAGREDVARRHYQQVLKMSEGGEGTREELKVAKAFLSRT